MKKEYTISEMKSLLNGMSGMYDLTRVVDPIECRVLELQDDGHVKMGIKCYSVWDSDQKCIDCSSSCAHWSGCHHQKTEHFQGKLFNIHSNPVTLKMDDGGSFEAVLELVSVVNDPNNSGVNITHTHDREAEDVDYSAVKFRAHHDGLTRTLNAEAFYERSREKLTVNSHIGWVMAAANIMNFRMVNTLFGVAKGNEVLMRLADLLNKTADGCGGLCGRLAGDYFALLLPKKSFSEQALLDAAETVARETNNGVYSLYIHFGIYDIVDSSVPVSVMCDRANMALRTKKGVAKSCAAYFDKSMMERSLFEHEVISSFDAALKSGQFRVYLQPLVGDDGRPFGAEALVRWVRPDGSIVSPADFIEILERAGLIHELDMYMWEQAASWLGKWKNTSKDRLTISVNMSAKDFYSIDVYGVLTGLLKKYDIPAGRLRLEITETAVLEDPERSISVISRLREAGFYVEIDDFGKDHSSLSMLKDIHVDMLKIDMGFLRETENRERSDIILSSVINMANSLGMDVVTEGVETEQQLRSLYSMGCRFYQGYYFSRPIPAEEFDRNY